MDKHHRCENQGEKRNRAKKFVCKMYRFKSKKETERTRESQSIVMRLSWHSCSATLFSPSQMHLVLRPTPSPTGQHAKHKSKLLQLSPQSPVYQWSLVSCHDSLCLSSESYTSHPRPLQTQSQGQTALPRQQEGWSGSWSWLLSDASGWHLLFPSTGHVKRFQARAEE